jgi:tRNA(Ile2) C34 agmatinyltransferase TiaS
MAEIFLAIDDVERRIEEKRQEIEKLRAEGAETKEKVSEKAVEENLFCPQCGAKLQAGDVYCAKCGTRVV